VFACRLEPSCQLWWVVASHRRYAADLLPPVTALAGMPRRELDDEALCHLPRWPS
jgi:hypothetical protein